MEQEAEEIFYNLPQLMFAIAMCRDNFAVWSRRGGKTEGPAALFTIENVETMPRSNGFVVGATYTQLLTRTLPPLIGAWEKLGYRENEHYWVRKYAPSKLGIPKAYRHPISAEHYIHWYNGSGMNLISQDRPGSSNGLANQWGTGDEAKFLNKERLDEELMLTLSGHYDMWGDKWNHLSTLFLSDMPTNTTGRWLIESEKKMDRKQIDFIIGLSQELQDLQEKLLTSTSKSATDKVSAEISKVKYYINELKKTNTYFSSATTIDNIHVLGLDVIKSFYRSLDPITFRTSVLNEYIAMVESCFYVSLNVYKHGYNAENYNYIDSIDVNFRDIPERDCRWDDDLNPGKPLEIACDYNNKINCVITGQRSDFMNEYRFLNSMFVKEPYLLDDLVKKWCDYYQYRTNKDVIYVFDQTAKGTTAASELSFSDLWIRGLRARGWNVYEEYIGEAPRHKSRHYLWNTVLQEKSGRFPLFRFNKENAKAWQLSCERAGTIVTGNDKRDIKKDKRTERSTVVPAEESTHLSEAGDTLFWYWYSEKVAKVDSGFMPLTIM